MPLGPCVLLALPFSSGAAHEVGFARVDVTPPESIRLSGYAARSAPTASVAQRLFARAMAIDGAGAAPAIVVAVDSIGIPWRLRVELAARLDERASIEPERIALLSTHSHTAPQLAGQLENIFGMPIVPEEQAAIERYTAFLVDRMEEAALAALSARVPAELSFARGSAGFAANRRTSGGPVDRSVPLLAAHGADGERRSHLETRRRIGRIEEPEHPEIQRPEDETPLQDVFRLDHAFYANSSAI